MGKMVNAVYFTTLKKQSSSVCYRKLSGTSPFPNQSDVPPCSQLHFASGLAHAHHGHHPPPPPRAEDQEGERPSWRQLTGQLCAPPAETELQQLNCRMENALTQVLPPLPSNVSVFWVPCHLSGTNRCKQVQVLTELSMRPSQHSCPHSGDPAPLPSLAGVAQSEAPK